MPTVGTGRPNRSVVWAEEMGEEERDVLAALAERRQAQGGDLEAALTNPMFKLVEILMKAAPAVFGAMAMRIPSGSVE